MAYYLVSGLPLAGRLSELRSHLAAGDFVSLRPFGRALSDALRNARMSADGSATWEEEDYCSPPLAEERAAVLDRYFEHLEVLPVKQGEGWTKITALPFLFPEVAVR